MPHLGQKGVGLVAFLQYHNITSHVEVRKVIPEVGPVGILPQKSRHWAPESREHFQEGNLIGLILPQGWGWWGLIPP